MKQRMMCLSLCKGFEKIVAVLIRYKANVNALNKDGNSPLHFASIRGIENCQMRRTI